jgi:hypothetical protein
MPRESIITILRSTSTDIPTGLTFGELAYSDLNGRLFVGKNDGSSLWVGAGITAGSISTNSDYLVPTQSAVKTYVDGVVGGGSVVNTFNGSGGAITLTGDSGAISNLQSTTSNKITARLATASLTGVASFNSTYLTVSNGAVSLASAYQVTGDTVAAGTGIAVSKSGNTSTVTNTGVLSFNSATGAVNYSPAIASSSVTGVASFNSTYFTVGGNGAVTLAGAYQVTGQTVVSGGGSQTVTTSGNIATIDNRVASASVTGVASFNSTYLTVSNGAVSLASAYQVTGDTFVGGGTGIAVSRSGNTSTVTNTGIHSFNGTTGSAITLTGDATNGVITIVDSDKATFNVNTRKATTTLLGVASFSSSNFVVSGAGVVTLSKAIPDSVFASTSVTGVASFRSTFFDVGATGVVTLASSYQVTGDTIAAGTGIAVSRSGNTSTVTNIGVQSFNGATGVVGYSPAFASSSVTGVASFNSTYFAVGATGVVTLASSYQATGQTVVSGGSSQLVSTSGNTVTIDNRVATASLTGVASFNSTYLTVSNGAVSLASAYQVTGDTVVAGTGIVVSKSGNTSTVTNSGVQSFNGATGAVGYSPVIATTSVTGVASFNSTHFTVSGAGAVSSTGITVKVSSGDAGSTLNSGGILTITGTANEINIQRTASTYTIGLPNDVTIGGNLTVNGTVVTANVDSFVVEDPLIMLGTGNAADSVDLGFYSQYTASGRLFSGFFRDASDSGKYKLFTGLTGAAEPTTTVNVAGSGYTVATLVAKIDGGSF